MVRRPQSVPAGVARYAVPDAGFDRRGFLQPLPRDVLVQDGSSSKVRRCVAPGIGQWLGGCFGDGQCHHQGSRQWISAEFGRIDGREYVHYVHGYGKYLDHCRRHSLSGRSGPRRRNDGSRRRCGVPRSSFGQY